MDMNIKRQIFDFVNGSLYALDGKIQKVNKDIFLSSPSNIEIEGLNTTRKGSISCKYMIINKKDLFTFLMKKLKSI